MKRMLVAMVIALLAGVGTSLAQPASPSRQVVPGGVMDPQLAASGPEFPADEAEGPATLPQIYFLDLRGGEAPGVPQVWCAADYLMWWVRRGPLAQPLVTTGPQTDPFPGALGQPATEFLFGGNRLDYSMFSGLRVNAGFWFDPDKCFGFQGSWFQLEQRSVAFNDSGGPNGQTYLAEPYINGQNGTQNVYFISQNFSNPALNANLTGAVAIASTSRLWGWESNAALNLIRSTGWTIDMLAGYRQLTLTESLTNTVTVTDLGVGGAAGIATTPVPPPYYVTTYDSFRTSNRFNGGQVGGRFNTRSGLVTMEVIAKVGLGTMSEVLTINGLTSTNAPLPQQVYQGGIYAQTSNIGTYSRRPFTVVPEVDCNLGIDVTCWLRARFGYTFLSASNVVRPGAQIDPVLNRNLVPIDINYGTPGGPNRPAVLFKENTFWAMGMNFGLEVVY